MSKLTFAPIEPVNKWYRHPDQQVLFSDDHHEYVIPHKGIEPTVEESTYMRFIHMDKESNYTNGVADEQLLEILIDRSEYFQSVLPCPENEIALMGLRIALAAKNRRTELRQQRGVEGTHRP